MLGRGQGAARAADHTVHGAVAVGHHIGRWHRDAEAAVGCRHAGVGLAAHRQRHDVARHILARDLAGDVDRARGLARRDEVVCRDRINGQRRLCWRVGVGLDDVVLGRVGFVASGARHIGFDLGVFVRQQVGCGHRNAVAAVGRCRAGVRLAVDVERDDIARSKGAADLARHVDGARLARRQQVVSGNRVNGDGRLGADVGRVVRVRNDRWRGARGGRRRQAAIQAVVLDSGGTGAAGASDTAIDDRVAIGQQVGSRDADAEATIGRCGAVEGLAVDHQDHHIACDIFAANFAGEGDGAVAFCGADDVVGGDRIDGQRGLGGGVARFERVVLCSGSVVTATALDGGFNLGIRVSLQVGHGHQGAVVAVGVDEGGISFPVELELHHIARGELSGDFACDVVSAGALLAEHQHVVCCDRVDRQCGFTSRTVVSKIFGIDIFVASGVCGFGCDGSRWHRCFGGDAPIAIWACNHGVDDVTVGILDHDRSTRLGGATDGVQ